MTAGSATDTHFAHNCPWGTQIVDGGARFRLWAPAQETVSLLTGTGARVPLQRCGDGWFETITNAVPVGGSYHYVLQDGMRVPDPAARAQMGDVHGASRLVDPRAYDWQTPEWRGRPWAEAILYELHTGTYSTDGTFDAISRDLDRLAEVGVTAIELLPVAQFGGNRGWGYDGVLLYAPHTAYGGPEDLKRLVDAAHERGLMVILDVVYNHFGPDGNYLHLYAPDFFDDNRHTPWGPAIAFDRAPVRNFFIHNALYWLQEYRFDGLRLDAVDHIKDASEEEILAEMAREIRDRIPDRYIHLTIEDDENTTRLFSFNADNDPRLYDAEWNDDWHHTMHVVLTGENAGYYQDYAKSPVARLAQTLAEGYGYQSEPSPFRGGKSRGSPSAHLPPTVFIDFLQNHDQAGNRPEGDRITTLAKPEAIDAALALLLLSPHIPLLFMGDEYGETRPFLFFTDFEGQLADAVRKGRREEFRNNKAFAHAYRKNLVPDPNAKATFERCVLAPAQNQRLDLVKRLVAARKAHVIPHLSNIGAHAGTVTHLRKDTFSVRWNLRSGGALTLTANLSGTAAANPSKEAAEPFFTQASNMDVQADTLPPWSVIARLSI